MTCADLADSFPDLIAGDLPPDTQKRVADHLAACPVCRRAAAELRAVTTLLKSSPVPAVRVDLPALYRAAAEREARRARRWRRLALSASAAAASLLAALALQFEIRAEGHQVVVRWGVPAEAPAPPHPPASQPSDAAPTADRVRSLEALVQGLADEIEARDERHRQQLDGLRIQIREVSRQAELTGAAAELDRDALYMAHFPIPKGVNP